MSALFNISNHYGERKQAAHGLHGAGVRVRMGGGVQCKRTRSCACLSAASRPPWQHFLLDSRQHVNQHGCTVRSLAAASVCGHALGVLGRHDPAATVSCAPHEFAHVLHLPLRPKLGPKPRLLVEGTFTAHITAACMGGGGCSCGWFSSANTTDTSLTNEAACAHASVAAAVGNKLLMLFFPFLRKWTYARMHEQVSSSNSRRRACSWACSWACPR
jgi:hypothetical protein